MKLLRYWKSIIWTLIITTLSLASFESADKVSFIPHQDKLVHFAMYFWLSFFISWETKQTKVCKSKFVLPFVAAACYGLLMEIAQAFSPHRSAEMLDALANSLGAAAGAVAYVYVCRFIKRLG